MTWEYRILECDANKDALAAELVPQGKQGFELISVLPFSVKFSKLTWVDRYRLIFKRSAQDESKRTSFSFATQGLAQDFDSALNKQGVLTKPLSPVGQLFLVYLQDNPNPLQIYAANKLYANSKHGFLDEGTI